MVRMPVARRRRCLPFNVHLTLKAVRLLELCEAEGFEKIDDLLLASIDEFREVKMSTERIRELNDAFRSTSSGGKVMMTPALAEFRQSRCPCEGRGQCQSPSEQ
jgi:hypothetical protein